MGMGLVLFCSAHLSGKKFSTLNAKEWRQSSLAIHQVKVYGIFRNSQHKGAQLLFLRDHGAALLQLGMIRHVHQILLISHTGVAMCN